GRDAHAVFEAGTPHTVKHPVNASHDVDFIRTTLLRLTQTDTVTTPSSSLSLHDALPISADVTAFTCSIDVTKSANPTSICSGQSTADTYSYPVKPTHIADLTGLNVSDNKITGAEAAFEAANPITERDTLTPGQ